MECQFHECVGAPSTAVSNATRFVLPEIASKRTLATVAPHPVLANGPLCPGSPRRESAMSWTRRLNLLPLPNAAQVRPAALALIGLAVGSTGPAGRRAAAVTEELGGPIPSNEITCDRPAR